MSTARRDALLAWYDANRRPFPWRQTRDPYAVLVSEVMAQQTQIMRVVAYYERFLALFPTPESLARAPLAEVLAAWSGLGYNRRARFLHGAAAHVVEHGWPTTSAGLQALPGVGPYTAAAVASIAFGEPVPAVDTNVKRVLSRWEATPLEGTRLAEAAAAALDGDRPADWNQAMMDLGARVCTPKPDCGSCPVTAWCSDASVYSAPARQARFSGSTRQARGAVIKALVHGNSATHAALAKQTGLATIRLQEALEALESDGLVERSGRRWRLPATAGAISGVSTPGSS